MKVNETENRKKQRKPMKRSLKRQKKLISNIDKEKREKTQILKSIMKDKTSLLFLQEQKET